MESEILIFLYVEAAESFIAKLWEGERAPAKVYVQDEVLPVSLTYASYGAYENTMSSVEDMEYFIEGLTCQMDDAANMDS